MKRSGMPGFLIASALTFAPALALANLTMTVSQAFVEDAVDKGKFSDAILVANDGLAKDEADFGLQCLMAQAMIGAHPDPDDPNDAYTTEAFEHARQGIVIIDNSKDLRKKYSETLDYFYARCKSVWGQIHLLRQDYRAARDDFQTAAKLDPKNGGYWYWVGLLSLMINDMPTAKAALKTCAAIPNYPKQPACAAAVLP